MKLYTSEQVACGHPDKICDQISDAILDAYLEQDENSRVAVETLIKNDTVVVAGEVTSTAHVNVDSVIQYVLKDVEVQKADYKIINLIDKQSPDIALGVDAGGAGDQGMMYGYACNETEQCLPLPYMLATDVLKDLRTLSHPMLGSDAKSQVTLQYNDDGSRKIHTFLVSTQHDASLDQTDVKNIVLPVILSVSEKYNLNDDFNILVNPTGRFVVGGSWGDSGVTGRKIIADSYGGYSRHGGGAFCVDGETEFLSCDGWKKISDYSEGDLVAQWDGKDIELVKPQAFIISKADLMYHIVSSNGIDMVVSENHDMVFKTSKGNLIKKRVKDILNERQGLINGFTGRIPIAFEYYPTTNIPLTDDEIRLQCAFCADGTILKNQTWSGRIRIKKDYKITRLQYLLDLTKTQYSVSQDGDFSIYYFNPPVLNKSIYDSFKDASHAQMKVISEEIPKWDGNCKSTYRTTLKKDADFAQLCFISTTNRGASILCDNRVGEQTYNGYARKSICYTITQLQHSDVGLKRKRCKDSLRVLSYIPEDGQMYCFTMPTGMFVARRNDKIFVTGNSGKDPSKVDRSAAYMARHIAKHLLKRFDLAECELQLSYAIGVAQPISINVVSQGVHYSHFNSELETYVRSQWDLTPKGIIEYLDLKHVKYYDTAKYGHFTNKNFNWEII